MFFEIQSIQINWLTPDIKEILSVIARRLTTNQPGTEFLENPDLSGTALNGADLYKANLVGVNFNNSHLEEAYLENASLNNSLLYETNLYGANLKGAVLTDAKFLTSQQISRACLTLEGDGKRKLSASVLLTSDLSGSEDSRQIYAQSSSAPSLRNSALESSRKEILTIFSLSSNSAQLISSK